MTRRYRLITRCCGECKNLFLGNRLTKYCGDKCKRDAQRRQHVKYERKVKRHTYKYRKKKDENQLDLALDSNRTEPYKDAS